MIDLVQEPPTGETRALAPSTESFDEVFEREYKKMVRLAYLMTGDDGRAEEVVQEAFATLHRRWDDVQSPGGFLRTTVCNKSRDTQRHQIRARKKLRLLRPVIDVTERPYLVDALLELSPRRREAVVLRYYGGHTIPEIADITGMAEGTVKSTLHRALEELKKTLKSTD